MQSKFKLVRLQIARKLPPALVRDLEVPHIFGLGEQADVESKVEQPNLMQGLMSYKIMIT